MAAGTLASLWTKKLKPAPVQPRPAEHDDSDGNQRHKGDVSMGECGGKEPVVAVCSPVHSPSAAKLPSLGGLDEAMDGQDRKRKRTGMSEGQLERLQAFFGVNMHPTSEETQNLATETGLDTAQVQQWFKESRSKKACLAQGSGTSTAAGSRGNTQEHVILLNNDDDENDSIAAATPGSQGVNASPVQTPRGTAVSPAPEQPGSQQQAEDVEAEDGSRQLRGEPCGDAEGKMQSPSSKGGGKASGPRGPGSHKQWSAEWMCQQLAAIEAEAGEVRGFVQALQSLQPLPEEALSTVNKAQVATLVAGSELTIGQLLERLHKEPMDCDFLRTCILDLATRKSFAAKEGKGERDDALTNEDPALLWRWELRNLQALPKSQQPAYKQLKKTLHEAGARLTALKAAQVALSDAQAKGKATPKAEKALAKLAKTVQVKGLQPLPGSAAAAAESGPVVTVDDGAAMDDTSPLGSPQPPKQEAAGHSKKAEKEALRRDREAEKARQKAEKEALREQQRQEKEKAKEQQKQEKEQQKQEKEQQKQGKKSKTTLAGFGSAETIAKSRMAFTSFFKKTPAPGGFSRSALKAAATPNLHSPLKGRALDAAFSPQESADRGPDEALQAAIERELQAQRSPKEVQSSFKSLLARWKALPKHRRVKGLPPSWARRLGGRIQPAEAGDDELSCCTWRRKFLWFPAELGEDGLAYPQLHWPPYYGSWSKQSSAVKPRRPLAKDPALDYEVMEDEEWEPEPEGDSLSNDEADEEDNMVEDSANDGFFVPDGQLSDDEGLSSAQQDIDAMCAETEDDLMGGADCSAEAASMAALVTKQRLLVAAMRKAAPHPLIISRLRPDSSVQGCLHGDVALLGAFAAQIVTPGLQACVPAALEAGTPAKAPAARAEKAPGGLERRDELVPELLQFLQDHPEIKAVSKVVQAFCEAHADRKPVKKWVADNVRQLAERQPGGWRIRNQPTSLQQPAKEQRATSATPAPSNSQLLSHEVESTADPRWRTLVSALVDSPGNDSGNGNEVFSVVSDTIQPGAVPAFALAALLKSLGSEGAANRQREACARALAQLVTTLATAQPSGLKSPPHKVWGDARTAPEPASLATFFAEAQLRPLLLRCLQASSVEVAKNTGLLLGALVRVGCPAKLGSKAGAEQGEGARETTADAVKAAAAFRAALAEDSDWVKALAAAGQSATLQSYKLLVLCYMLHDCQSRQALLGDSDRYAEVIAALLAGCREQHVGCSKYGAVGLAYLLRWHKEAPPRVLAAADEASLAIALTAMLQGKKATAGEPDEATFAALEAARQLGEATGAGVASQPGLGAAPARRELIEVLRALSNTATGTAAQACRSALQALGCRADLL